MIPGLLHTCSDATHSSTFAEVSSQSLVMLQGCEWDSDQKPFKSADGKLQHAHTDCDAGCVCTALCISATESQAPRYTLLQARSDDKASDSRNY